MSEEPLEKPELDPDDASQSADVTPTGAERNIGERRIRRAPRRSTSAISGREFRKRDLIPIDDLRPSLSDRIRQDFPNLPSDALISRSELARYRMLYIEELLQEEHGEFSELDRQVAESIANQDTVAENTEDEFDDARTFGERLSDHMASFGGSWAFLISFFVILCIWMSYNIWAGSRHVFDPYPFILLNLVLSCVAAIQAPIIMMSQKRQETKDRLRAYNDYRVNLKAELEVRHLHEKLDYLASKQWSRLAEIQRMQLEIMQEKRIKKDKKVKQKADRNLEDTSSGTHEDMDS